MKFEPKVRPAMAVFLAALAAAAGLLAAGGQYALAEDTRKNKIGYTDEFFLGDCTWADEGANRFFVLKPNYQTTFEGEEDGEKVVNVITVTEDTKEIDGVKTRIMQERETHDGELAEISRNYFAICKETNSVFYFGEEVDLYENGKIVGHEGQWQSGKDGARAGLMMPGIVLINAKYQQETAPDVAMDRARVVSMDESIKVPAGDFDNVLKIRETTPLEPDATEYKFYAAGIGLVQDDTLKLVEHKYIG